MIGVSPNPVLSKNVALCALRPADAEIAAQTIRAAFLAQRLTTCPPSSALGETAETLAAKIATGCGFGVCSEEKLAAVALWRLDDGVLLISRVCVLPSARGPGMARMLMAACQAEAGRLGAVRMRLRARLELPENERMFERFGFQRVRVEAHAGFDQPTRAVTEKPLS